MICVFQFSLQNYEQKSIDLLLFVLNAVPNLNPVCSFHNLDFLIPFMIVIEFLYLELR